MHILTNNSNNFLQRTYALINCNTVEYAVPTEYNFTDYLGGGNYGNVM